jgi:hypothetical protein
MDDLIERTRQHLDEEPDGEMEILNEVISLRTGLIIDKFPIVFYF